MFRIFIRAYRTCRRATLSDCDVSIEHQQAKVQKDRIECSEEDNAVPDACFRIAEWAPGERDCPRRDSKRQASIRKVQGEGGGSSYRGVDLMHKHHLSLRLHPSMRLDHEKLR